MLHVSTFQYPFSAHSTLASHQAALNQSSKCSIAINTAFMICYHSSADINLHLGNMPCASGEAPSCLLSYLQTLAYHFYALGEPPWGKVCLSLGIQTCLQLSLPIILILMPATVAVKSLLKVSTGVSVTYCCVNKLSQNGGSNINNHYNSG